MKTFTIALIALLSLPLFVSGQKKIENETVYRRSSLYPLMIVEPNRKYADIIQKTFFESPIPDKFNNHMLQSRSIDNGIPPELKKREEKVKAQQVHITNYLNTNDIAKKMVAKWFNRKANGCFDMNLIAERGSYNATEMDVELAKSTKRGMALLGDAGEELIKNTFVVVNDFDYVSKEEVADKVKAGLGLLKEVAELVADEEIDIELTEETVTTFGKGYVVRTTSYLYQLVWNDSVAAVFYNDYWISDGSQDEARKKAFENSDIFKLKLVGWEVAWADLQSTIYTTKSEEDLITIASLRAIDAVIAKLQKKYEVFRTKTPLYKIDPLSAKIGLKEGLEKGDKFEVLEQIMTKEGRTEYKRKGIIKVNKDHIWDNRYMAGEAGDESNPKSQLGYTTFKGGGKYYEGMLIRQIN
jgi:hypothetical protein